MQKRILLAVLLPLMCGGQAIARVAPQAPQGYAAERLSEETLDTLLAPIALYPDTLVTHILIASTYPMQVIEADRWRQDNQSLDGDRLERTLENFDWDPSVKALVPFTDILRHMSDDLAWLQNLGDAVITNEDWVLDRVQALRLQAQNSGNLQSNDYQQISTENKIIVIESRRPEVVYIPYYDTRHVYGHWHYHTQPVFWPTTVRIALGHRIYFGPHVSISTGFYFGNIWWPERHIVIRRTPVHHYVRPSYQKRYSVKEYNRWQHNTASRHARYSHRVETHKPAIVKQHRVLNNNVKHRELYTKTQAVSGNSHQKAFNNKVSNKELRVKNAPAPKYDRNANQLKERLQTKTERKANQREPVNAVTPGFKQRDNQQYRVKPSETRNSERKWANNAPQRVEKANPQKREINVANQQAKAPQREFKNVQRSGNNQQFKADKPRTQANYRQPAKSQRAEQGAKQRTVREH